MVLTSRYHIVATIGLILSLTSCAARDFVMRPTAPEKLSSAEASPLGIADSVINVPVQLNLSAFLHAANDPKVVPKKFEHWGSVIKHPKGGEYKYYAERDDFAVETTDTRQAGREEPGVSNQDRSLSDWWKDIDLSGSSLFMSAPLRYKVGVHSQSQIAGAPAQCGDASEWPKRAVLHGNIAMSMTPKYDVSAFVRDVTVSYGDPCRLRLADVDVQQAVRAKLSDQIKGGLTNAVSRLNALSVKPPAEDVWTALRNPIQLEPDTWLLLSPDKVKRSGFSTDGHVLHDTLEITAHPVIVHGAEPPATPTPLPLIETEPTSAEFRGVADVRGDYPGRQPSSQRFHVLADAQIDYATLSASLTSRLRGKRVVHKGYFITMTGAKISGLGANHVLLRVNFDGDARGHVYLIGKPEINAMTQTMYLSGLRYDLKTTHLLQSAAPDWLYHAPLREAIAPEVVFGVTPATDRLRDLLKTGLNRALSPTVSMQGVVTSMPAIAVFADTDALSVRAMSNGTLTVTVGGTP
jgi:hypothetical protein